MVTGSGRSHQEVDLLESSSGLVKGASSTGNNPEGFEFSRQRGASTSAASGFHQSCYHQVPPSKASVDWLRRTPSQHSPFIGRGHPKLSIVRQLAPGSPLASSTIVPLGLSQVVSSNNAYRWRRLHVVRHAYVAQYTSETDSPGNDTHILHVGIYT
jgi:hypothetical protein